MTIYTSPNYPEFNPALSGMLPNGDSRDFFQTFWANATEENATYRMLYQLKSGWNFISFPFIFDTDKDTLDYLIPPTTYPNIDKIITSSESATVINDNWTGSIDTIDYAKSYWVHNNLGANVELEIRGACLYGSSATDVSWGAGINYISYPLCNDITLADAIQYDLTDDNVNTIITSEEASYWNGNDDIFAGSLNKFNNGKGYFINIDSGITGTFWEDNTPKPMSGHPIWDNNESPPQWGHLPFHYTQSSIQCFYIIDGGVYDVNGVELIPGEDWIGAFRGDVCCGAFWYHGKWGNTYTNIEPEWSGSGEYSNGAGFTTIPTNLVDSMIDNWQYGSSWGQYRVGEIPTFVIYQHSTGNYYLAKFKDSNGDLIDMSNYAIASNDVYMLTGDLHAISEIT